MPETRRSIAAAAALRWLFLRPVVAQQLTVGVPSQPHDVNEVHQMAFDPANRTLYSANGCCTIVQVSEVSTAPLTPSPGAPWAYSIVAGHGTRGPPGPDEMNATAATFFYPGGVVGWPQYAVGPTTSSSGGGATSVSSSPWVGLWIADSGNHAIRFIDFDRGNNVTLVAGSPSGDGGAKDGFGAAALLGGPTNVAWGRFLRSAVLGPTTTPTAIAAVGWTSVVYWTDQGNNCLRQGVPLHNDAAYSPLEDIPPPPLTGPSTLSGMILNVSAFAGVCDGGYGIGNATGPLVPWSKMFWNPVGIALVGLPTAAPTTMTPTVLFIGDYKNQRLCMIAPMYPPAARTLTVLGTSGTYNMMGVTIGRIHSGPSYYPPGGPTYAAASTSSIVVGVELHVSAKEYGSYLNVSLQVWVNTTTSSPNTTSTKTTVGILEDSVTTTALVPASAVFYTHHTALVRRYITDSNGTTTSYSTLVVGSGWNYDRPSEFHALEFYCCLDGSYSDPIVLEDTSMGSLQVHSESFSRSRSSSAGGRSGSGSRSGASQGEEGGGSLSLRRSRSPSYGTVGSGTGTQHHPMQNMTHFSKQNIFSHSTTLTMTVRRSTTAVVGPPRNSSGSGASSSGGVVGVLGGQHRTAGHDRLLDGGGGGSGGHDRPQRLHQSGGGRPNDGGVAVQLRRAGPSGGG